MNGLYEVLVFFVSLGIVISIFMGPYQWLWVEVTRQKLFEARDAIFDMAAEGKLRFDDPAYVDLRKSLNIMIRCAHRVGLIRTIFVSVIAHVGAEPTRAGRAVGLISDRNVADEVQAIMSRADRAIVRLIIWRNPLVAIAYGIWRISGIPTAAKRSEVNHKVLATLQAEAESDPDFVGLAAA